MSLGDPVPSFPASEVTGKRIWGAPPPGTKERTSENWSSLGMISAPHWYQEAHHGKEIQEPDPKEPS